MKKIVLKLEFSDEKIKQKAMRNISRISGVESISMDLKDKKLTVIGDIDPVAAVAKLRKLCYTEIISVGPAKEPEKQKEEPKKEEPKKEEPKKKDEPKEDEGSSTKISIDEAARVTVAVIPLALPQDTSPSSPNLPKVSLKPSPSSSSQDISARRARLSMVEEIPLDLSFVAPRSLNSMPLVKSHPLDADMEAARINLRHFLSIDLLNLGEAQQAAMFSALHVIQSSPTFAQSASCSILSNLPTIISKSKAAASTSRRLASELESFHFDKENIDAIITRRRASSQQLIEVKDQYDECAARLAKLKAETAEMEAIMLSLIEKGEAFTSSIAQDDFEIRERGKPLLQRKEEFEQKSKELEEAEYTQMDCYAQWASIARAFDSFP